MPQNNTPEVELEFEKMLVTRTERWVKENEHGERFRTALGVTLHRRFMNDYYGYWDKNLNSYLEVPSAGLKSWPIIGPVVRTNNSNWLSTRIQLEITSNSSDPVKMGGERVARALFQNLYENLWTDTHEELMALYCQLSFNWFGVSGCSARHGQKKMKVTRLRKEEVETDEPEYQCSECGASGPATDLAADESGVDLAGPVQCPACGNMAATADSPTGDKAEVEVTDGYDEVNAPKNFFKILPSFLFRVDEVNGKAADLSGCQFVNMNRLSRRYELRENYGEEAVKGLTPNDGKEWLDPVKWWHRLESGTIATEKDYKASGGAQSDDDLLQESIWWCTPASVAAWKSPSDYSHPCGFKIKKNQTIADAFKEAGKTYTGLYFVMAGKKLLYVCPENHNDVLVSGLWIMNGASFWGKGQQELNDIQEAANAFFSMFYEYGMHSSMPQRIYDGNMFDRKDFKNRAGGMTPTRKGFMRNGKPLKYFIETLEPGRMSGDMFVIWESLVREGGEDIGGTPKSVVGQGDPTNKTAGGQALLTQRGLSLLIPSQKSKGQGLKRWAPQQLKFVQDYWSNEQIKEVLTKVDQSWEDQDVEAFRNMDLRFDLTYKVVPGTDIPVSHSEKEQRLMMTLPVLINPRIPVELRQQIARLGNIDYDPDHIERERRHQTQVLKKIKEACKYVEKSGIGYVQTEAGMEINPEALDRILSLPGLEILQRSENLPWAKQFFDNEIVALHTADHPDQLLLAVLQRRVDMLIEQQVTNDADTAKIMGALNQAQGGEQGQGGGEDPAAKAQLENMKIEGQRQTKQMELGYNRETQLQLADRKFGHDVQLEKMRLQVKQMEIEAQKEQEIGAKIPDRASV